MLKGSGVWSIVGYLAQSPLSQSSHLLSLGCFFVDVSMKVLLQLNTYLLTPSDICWWFTSCLFDGTSWSKKTTRRRLKTDLWLQLYKNLLRIQTKLPFLHLHPFTFNPFFRSSLYSCTTCLYIWILCSSARLHSFASFAACLSNHHLWVDWESLACLVEILFWLLFHHV